MVRVATLLTLLLCARAAGAQCPDGSVGANSNCSQAKRALPIDANRIAVFPLRVAAADSLLGEGLAELMSTELTGQGSPRATDMATTLSVWRHAGGALRAPLTLDAARKLARDLGAGLLIDGSVVVLGGSVTLTASVVNSVAGTIRGAPVRVTAHKDSLEALLRRAIAGVIVAAGGDAAARPGLGYSESPAAMRAYMEGLREFRRGHQASGVRAFDAAIAADSVFPLALYWRYLAGEWVATTTRLDSLARRAWDVRKRLPPTQRTVLEGKLGQNYPAARTHLERYADFKRMLAALPDSPDAMYFMGDFLWHYGAPVEPRDWRTTARTLFERSVAIDSQAEVLRHLVELGVRSQDTALIRRTLPAFERTRPENSWCFTWMAAAELRDAPLLGAMRRAPAAAGPPQQVCRAIAAESSVPKALIDEMYAIMFRAGDDVQKDSVLYSQGYVRAVQGQPAGAEEAWRGIKSPQMRASLFNLRMFLAIVGAGDGLDVASSLARLDSQPRDSALGCAQSTWVPAVRLGLVKGELSRPLSTCQQVQLLDRATALGPTAKEAAAALDSVLSLSVGGTGFETLLTAAMWERLGRLDRAAVWIRRGSNSDGPAMFLYNALDEGRIALAIGDTATAIRAWRGWVNIMRDAEPGYRAKRDSVSALLTTLERRR